MLIAAPLLLPLATALITALFGSRPRACRTVSIAGAGANLFLSSWLLFEVVRRRAAGPLVMTFGDWPLPYGIAFAADGLSALLVAATALLGFAVVMAARVPEGEAGTLHPLLHALLAGGAAVFLAADLFNLYVWFELLFVATLGLLVSGGGPREAEGAFKYFALSMLGTLLLLASVGGVFAATGQLSFDALREASGQGGGGGALTVFAVLAALAVLLKAGAFPLYPWLPAAYPVLPGPALALAGGLLTKVAAYALLRLVGGVFTGLPAQVFEALGLIALLTMVSGGLGAAYHWDLRRILAFHIVSQIGYLLLGIALASPEAAAATGFFLLHNLLVKGNLFLIAWLMASSGGHHDLRRLGGLLSSQPLLAVLFFVNAFSLVGVPPSSGFWGKFMLVSEALEQERFLWAAVALATGLLTLYSMAKIWLEGFWKGHPVEGARPVAPPAPPLVAAGLLTLAVLVLGLHPEPVIATLEPATRSFWAAR